MTKVAVITAATNTIPRFRIDMVDEFVRRGCDVVVLGDELESDWEGYFSAHGVRYRSYRVSRNGMNPLADLATVRELAGILREERPDKVFTYQAKPNIYGALAARLAGAGDVYAMMGGLGSVFEARDARSRFTRAVVSAEYRVALRGAAATFFQNTDDVATFSRLRVFDDPARTVMVRGSGVNLERFPASPLPATFSFLFVGRLVRGKGVLDYLEAARRVKAVHPEVSFLIVGPYDTNPTALGSGDLAPYIEDGTAVHLGELPADKVQNAVEACSAFVLPSYYGEGTPKSALEAMATGRPLVMADAVGCREVVRDGENGFLVPPQNPEAIAAAMLRLIEEPGLASRMGAASRRMAEELFDVRKVNEVICETMGIRA